LKTKRTTKLITLIFVAIIVMLNLSGCSRDQLTPLERDLEKPKDSDPAVEVELSAGSNYYWPWISHGHLDLSSGETVSGPDLFESDPGFIAEFNEDISFDGLLVWKVEKTDVFMLEWVRLSFHVEYYEQNERLLDLYYEFLIDELLPEPIDNGIREYAVNLVDRQEDFEVVIKKVILGKEQHSSFSVDPINYVAIELEMKVRGNP
jgi:hypothetical protein